MGRGRSGASNGGVGGGWGGRSYRRRRGPRRPKLWWRRVHRNGAREGLRFAPTASTSARELVGLGGVTKRSPEWRRRPARAAASFGSSRSSGYGAHGGRRGAGVGSGEARSRAGRRGGSPAAGASKRGRGRRPEAPELACVGVQIHGSVAELVDMSRGRRGGGGCGYDGRRRRAPLGRGRERE